MLLFIEQLGFFFTDGEVYMGQQTSTENKSSDKHANQ